VSRLYAETLHLCGGSNHRVVEVVFRRVDLGFHYGNQQDFVRKAAGRVRKLRKRGAKCERLGRRPPGGGAPGCVGKSLQKIRNLCGPLAETICT
jgi:hypothetical protein